MICNGLRATAGVVLVALLAVDAAPVPITTAARSS